MDLQGEVKDLIADKIILGPYLPYIIVIKEMCREEHYERPYSKEGTGDRRLYPGY